MRLSEGDWVFINNLTYKIHAIEDFDQMRLEFLKEVRLSIPYDRAAFYLADKTRPMGLCDPVGVDFTKQQLEIYIERYEDIDPFKSVTSSPFSYVYRESDLISQEEKTNSSYYKLAYGPLNIQYGMFMGISYEKEYLGTAAFYRKKGEDDFSDEDVYKLDLLKEHLSLRTAEEMGLCSARPRKDSEEHTILSICKRNGLTEREIQVVAHLYRGDATSEICQELCIAPTTLKKHITNAYKKMGIGCRAQLYKLLNNG